jgi:histidinol dehydrogenase
MLTPIVWKDLNQKQQETLLQRPVQQNENLAQQVQAIITKVREGNDSAIKDLTQKFDGVSLDNLQVTEREFVEARKRISTETFEAILRAIKQIEAFHIQQMPTNIRVETSPGIVCERQTRSIQRVGLYIPGGSAPLVSTVTMLGVPAKIAGCQLRVLCTPPRKDGTIDPHILVAAQLCDIQKVYKVGGAQAIAAMAYGTETIPKVDKIFGPGNSWVTQAKINVAQDVAGALYDMPAGPSEVLVIADETANPEFVAADLLSQAEHGADSQVILLCTNTKVANEVGIALERQLKLLSRKDIAEQSLKISSLILVESLKDALNISNHYAPEHLILQVKNARQYMDKIECAGSVFLGAYSPESAGDYASGTNHVLPTYGYAKSLSGLSVGDFMKAITFQELSYEGLADIAGTIRALTQVEGLDAHRLAVDVRLKN